MLIKKGLRILQGLAGLDANDPLVVKQTICQAAAAYLVSGPQGKQAPGDHLTIELLVNDATRPLFHRQLAEGRALEQAIRSQLRQEGATGTTTLQVELKLVRKPPAEMAFRFTWRRREISAKLSILQGTAEKKLYRLDKELRQTFIGREREVVDKHGFIVRHNHIVFLSQSDDVNGSVSRQHGWLQYDAAAQSFRLFDPESKQGTRLERSGQVWKVPPAGEVLQDGDLIYAGKSQMRYALTVSLTDC
jgi:hypothetical protein